MSKKTILLCGATGFIGRNLLEYYSNHKEYDLHATYFKGAGLKLRAEYPNVRWIYADLNVPQYVEYVTRDVDIVLQFAATTSGAKDITTKPYIHVTDNAVMNSLLLRSAYENGVEHFIFPSCTVMYQPSDDALKESDFNNDDELLSKYFGVGNTKVYIEKMCEFYSRLGRTKHTVLRHSNIYGPHDKYDLEKSHVFGATVTKVMTAESEVTMWGTGEEKRDLLHVSDLIAFIDAAIKQQQTPYELYNVGLGEAVTIDSLVKKIIKASGKELELKKDLSQPTIKTSLFLDCEKAKQDFGWEPKISLDEGIDMTLDWYRENLL